MVNGRYTPFDSFLEPQQTPAMPSYTPSYTGERPSFNLGLPDQSQYQYTGGEMFSPGSMNPTSGPNVPTFWDRFMGTKETGPGWGGTALSTGLGLGQLGLGFENLRLGKDQLKENKKQFSKQYDIQKQEINRDIQEKGERMSRINPNITPSAENYYEKYKLS